MPSELIKRAIPNIQYEKEIFLIENLGKSIKTEFRVKEFNEVIEIERLIKEVYESLGYKIITVKPAPLDERVQFILNELKTLPA